MAYSRIFITLNQCCQDYAKDVRGCVGKCVIELRNGFARFVLQVQGLRSDVGYRAVVLSEDKFADIKNPLYVDGSGKGEIRCGYDQNAMGIAVEDIRAVALLVKDKAPLIGFTKGEYNWQSCLMAKEYKAAEIAAPKAEVISIIEKIDDSIQEIKSIITSSNNEEYVFNKEHIKPFGEDNITWVKGSIKELGAIKDLWKYINNPYVVHSCMEYKHILLGKEGKSYWLGIPCKYDKSYTMEAKLQGFREYKPVNNGVLKEGEFCYCLLRCS